MIYANAVSDGVMAGELLVTGSNDQSRRVYAAVYNSTYGTMAKRFASADAKNIMERNIANVQQDKILSNMQLQISEAQQVAQIELSAALAGVTGGSVDAVLNQTRANAVMAKASVSREAEQATQSLLANVNSAQADMLSTRLQKTSFSPVGPILSRLASIDREDMKTAASFWGAPEQQGNQTIAEDWFNTGNMSQTARTA